MVPVSRGGPGLKMRLSSYPRPPATVIAVGGEIDACNADHFSDYLMGFLHLDHPILLDLSDVEFLGTAGFRCVLRFADECATGGREWALVPSTAVDLLLRVVNYQGLPVLRSIDEALQHLAALQGRSVTVLESKRC
jgi:anti-anti-sigma factor